MTSSLISADVSVKMAPAYNSWYILVLLKVIDTYTEDFSKTYIFDEFKEGGTLCAAPWPWGAPKTLTLIGLKILMFVFSCFCIDEMIINNVELTIWWHLTDITLIIHEKWPKDWAETSIFSYFRKNMDPKIKYSSAKNEWIINISKENVQTYVQTYSFQGSFRYLEGSPALAEFKNIDWKIKNFDTNFQLPTK